MKIQGFTIIFALVAIPLILVLTYYIQLQVNTITLQNAYDSKLLDATYDAMSSFELNTANEDLSSVSDSLRTIIEASNNVFFNTLATNLGVSNASKSYVEPYIPAMLYTLYDGYYISSPTQVPEVCTDSDGKAVSVGEPGVSGNGTYKYDSESTDILHYGDLTGNESDYGQLLYLEENSTDTYTTDIRKASKKTKNVLKTYMPYSARYKREDLFDITVVYTLDNYITVEGSIKKGNNYISYTKSGYLLPKNCVTDITITADVNLLLYNQNDAQSFIEAGNQVTVKIGDAEISSGGNGTYENLVQSLNSKQNQLESAINDNNIQDIENIQREINDIKYELNQMSSNVYYAKAIIFSDWVYKNLNMVIEDDLVEISGQSYTSISGIEQVTYSFDGSTIPVFETNGSEDKGITEIAEDSPFYTHKLNVIRNSIQYNLNLAMTTYNTQTAGTFNYEMPVMQNEEWNQILTNISFVSFMQGYACGLKTYNNYMVVSSTNNELTVNPLNIYYVEKDKFSDTNTEYHRIDCPKLAQLDNGTNEYISFTSKEVKYDKIYDKNATNYKYKYDHKNLACYDCINDGNYNKENVFDFSNASYKNLRKTYYMAVGKERNNIYKMNAIDNSEGYEIIYDTQGGNVSGQSSTLPLSDIKSIEIVIGTIKTINNKENLRYQYSLAGESIDPNYISPNSISSNDTNVTSIKINIDSQLFKDKTAFNVSINNLIVELDNDSTYLTSRNEEINTANGYIDYNNDGNISKEEKNRKIFVNAVKYIRVIYK